MSFFAGKRVLFLGAHVDDEILCAATLYRARLEGADVRVYACCLCQESLPYGFGAADLNSEFNRACAALGAAPFVGPWQVRRLAEHRQDVLEQFVNQRNDYGPDIVLCPSSTDAHQDHTVVYQEAFRAFRNNSVLLGYESPNNQRSSRIDFFVSITEEMLAHKVFAWKTYKSQRHRDHFDEDLIRSLASIRGRQCRCDTKLAEAYETLSMTV